MKALTKQKITWSTVVLMFIAGNGFAQWQLTGNGTTNPPTNFIGTTDVKDLVFKTNGTERMRIFSGGNIDITNSTLGLQLKAGNAANVFTSNQLLLSYGGGTSYTHAIKTRHNAGSLIGNAIDFFVWNYGVDAAGAVGTKNVMTLDGNGYVGMGITAPLANLDIYGTSPSQYIRDASGVLRFVTSSGINYIQSGVNTSSNSKADLRFTSMLAGTTWMTIQGSTGRVGIGTSTPSQILDITHNDATGDGISLNQLSSTNYKSGIRFKQNGNEKWAIGNDIDNNNGQNFFIWDNLGTATRLLINGYGKVGIGVTPPNNGTSVYKLYVDGGVVTRDVKVTAGAFPDYVFASEYKLMPISELEKYIAKNHHLPEIPSAKEIEKNEGFEIGDMQTKLVKKVEEQTLYIISLQKQLDELKIQMNKISKN